MNVTMYQPLPYNQMPPFKCIINIDIQSSINKHFIMSIYMYAICFSIKSNHALTGIVQHCRLSLYEKCDVHSVLDISV